MKFIEIAKMDENTWEVRNDQGRTLKTFKDKDARKAHLDAQRYAMKHSPGLEIERDWSL